MNDPDSTMDDAIRWLRFSREDLDVTELLLTRRPMASRHVCWLSQQAAEKALKAALVLEGIEFPFTHDLDAPRNPLTEGWSVRTTHSDLAELTQSAVETRCPGDWSQASEALGSPVHAGIDFPLYEQSWLCALSGTLDDVASRRVPTAGMISTTCNLLSFSVSARDLLSE